MNLDTQQFIYAVEMILEKEVKRSYPRYWNEDTISLNILRDIEATLNTVSITRFFEQRMQINWQAFKFTRKLIENKFGDIALLINISYQDGDKVEGVAFLEAKKRYRNQTKFGAIKNQQLKRIRKNAPSSMALLYDYEDVTEFANTNPFATVSNELNGLVWKPCTCAVVVPTKTILAIQKKDTTLYKFSIPFSHQLFFRYFHGFDLEFREVPIRIAKGYATEIGAPTYLAVVSVGFGEAVPSKDISFNRELFSGVFSEMG